MPSARRLLSKIYHLKSAFTLIELLVACHPKLSWDSKLQRSVQRRKAIPGFTLIELLVVISIIAILTATAAASYTNAQAKARDGKRKTDLKATQQALELYFQTNGVYPSYDAGSLVCTVGAATTISWGSSFTCNGITYMNPTPKDPSETTYQYFYERGYNAVDNSSDVTRTNLYRLSAKLENTSDSEFCESGCRAAGKLPCEPTGGHSYCVINP